MRHTIPNSVGTYLRQLTGEEVEWHLENTVAIGSAGGPKEKGLVFINKIW